MEFKNVEPDVGIDFGFGIMSLGFRVSIFGQVWVQIEETLSGFKLRCSLAATCRL